MQFRKLTAEMIKTWEREVGPTPVHGVHVGLLSGGAIEPHHHDRGQIILVRSGVITVTVGGDSWVASPTRAIWIPHHAPHHITASTGAELSNLQVSNGLIPHLPEGATSLIVSPLFRELMIEAVSGPNEIAQGSREHRILELLLSEFKTTSEIALVVPEPRDIRLKRACDTIRANLSDNRTLDEMATEAGGCARTLGRLFLKETGLTFAQWRRQARLLDAMTRLHQGQSITSIAYDTGYDSPSAFIEMFRRVMGCTPGQYLNS